MSLFQVVGKGIDDPFTAQALAKLYNVPIGDREALANRLRHVVWQPPYRPAPFVGHMAGNNNIRVLQDIEPAKWGRAKRGRNLDGRAHEWHS